MTEPRWGEAPVPDVLAALLAERHGLAAHERFDVALVDGGVETALVATRHTYRLRVTYESGPPGIDPWPVVLDAMDALVGQLLESGRDHRRLPTGSGVLYDDARLAVTVEKVVPELDAVADRWLRSGEDSSNE